MSNTEYPSEVLSRVKVLETYKVNPKLNKFDIFHLYPKGLAFPHGYYDSQFFDLYCFNSNLKEKRIIEDPDALDFEFGKPTDLNTVRIYADGSTFLRFGSMHGIEIFQCVRIL